MISLFFSYSHKDEPLRDELEKHLSVLKNNGQIDAWHDRRIEAGMDLNDEIDSYLEKADIILLLISSDFLASEYCYTKEMARALERNDKGEARVIPVILRDCYWQDSMGGKLSKLMATPKDAKPVMKFLTLDEAFLDIVLSIKSVVETIENRTIVSQSESKKQLTNKIMTKDSVRSSNLGITKEFTDEQRDTFLHESFEYMCNYFESSLEEVKRRNSEISYKFKKVDSDTFSVNIYRNGKSLAECSIWYGSGFFGKDSITYSSSATVSKNTSNGSLVVRDDGCVLYLEVGFGSYNSSEARLTQEGASEHFWSKLIEPLQRGT